MKVKELIEQISEYEDFDVSFLCENNKVLDFTEYIVTEVGDIAYSDKKVVLFGKSDIEDDKKISQNEELEQLRAEVERLRSELELSKTAAQRNWDKGKQALREAQERARNGEHRKYKPRKDTYDEKYGHMVRKMYAVGGKSYREIQKETGLSLNVISRLVQKYKLSEHKGQCVEYNGELKLKSEVPAEYLEQLANKKKRGRPRKNPVNS